MARPDDDPLGLVELRDDLVRQPKVSLDKSRRGKCQPLYRVLVSYCDSCQDSNNDARAHLGETNVLETIYRMATVSILLFFKEAGSVIPVLNISK